MREHGRLLPTDRSGVRNAGREPSVRVHSTAGCRLPVAMAIDALVVPCFNGALARSGRGDAGRF